MKIYGEQIDDQVVKRLFGTFPKKRQRVLLTPEEMTRLNPLEQCVFRLHVEHWIPRRYIYRLLRVKNDTAESAYYNACLKLRIMVRYQVPKKEDFYKKFMRKRIIIPIN